MAAEEPSNAELQDQERRQERASREALAHAESEAEAAQNERRADKARYLREKLEEQRQADEAVEDS